MKTELRPTPETDEAWAKWPYAGPGVHADFARKLERERDEAQERAESKHGLWMAELSRVTELEKQLEAMRDAIKEAYALVKDASGHCADKCILLHPDDDNKGAFNDVWEWSEAALAKLKPLLP